MISNTEVYQAAQLHSLVSEAISLGLMGCCEVNPRYLYLTKRDIARFKKEQAEMSTMADTDIIPQPEFASCESVSVSSRYPWLMAVISPIMVITASEWREGRIVAEIWVINPGAMLLPALLDGMSHEYTKEWAVVGALSCRVAKIYSTDSGGDCLPVVSGPCVDAVRGFISTLMSAVHDAKKYHQRKREELLSRECEQAAERLKTAENIVTRCAVTSQLLTAEGCVTNPIGLL